MSVSVCLCECVCLCVYVYVSVFVCISVSVRADVNNSTYCSASRGLCFFLLLFLVLASPSETRVIADVYWPLKSGVPG